MNRLAFMRRRSGDAAFSGSLLLLTTPSLLGTGAASNGLQKDATLAASVDMPILASCTAHVDGVWLLWHHRLLQGDRPPGVVAGRGSGPTGRSPTWRNPSVSGGRHACQGPPRQTPLALSGRCSGLTWWSPRPLGPPGSGPAQQAPLQWSITATPTTPQLSVNGRRRRSLSFLLRRLLVGLCCGLFSPSHWSSFPFSYCFPGLALYFGHQRKYPHNLAVEHDFFSAHLHTQPTEFGREAKRPPWFPSDSDSPINTTF
ncbi:hypothetical protein F5X68DRAFT_36854 [Plectosphaerella plurivora]|uniref:Secreted protein n=1 Tax=Plectosphaerella plurivora TaxID=936078 RepID=A0A9P8V6Y6_9PEZI|nr:hypothetical protein F5X68DRAFT_36854 [Plectosphaerella plurivora]